MPTATGFIDQASLTAHFNEHGSDFGATDEADYLAKARAFLERPLAAAGTVIEGVRAASGETVRFDSATDAFAVVQADGTIKTFFKPMPMRLAPPGTPRRKMHRFPTNRDYFLDACTK